MNKSAAAAGNETWPIAVSAVAFLAGQFLLWHLSAPVWVQAMYCIGFVGLIIGPARYHSFVFIFRVYLPIVIGLAMIWLYFWLHNNSQASVFIDAAVFRLKYLQLLFDVLSALYAICTAFLLWKGLTDHDTLRHALRDEANQIQRVIGFLPYFNMENVTNRESADKIRQNFLTYIDRICDGEKVTAHRGNSRLLRETIDLVQNFEPEDTNDEVALSETMKGMSDLVMARSRRISQMEISMSPYLLAALVIMSAAVLYPFFTAGPETSANSVNYVNAICIFILSSLLSFLQMTLFDISQPFNGYWKIKTDTFEEIQTILENELAGTAM